MIVTCLNNDFALLGTLCGLDLNAEDAPARTKEEKEFAIIRSSGGKRKEKSWKAQMNTEGFEKAINVFFRRPGLDYARQLRSALDEDPEYLKTHRDAITHGVKQLLRDGGISLDENVSKESATKLVWEAVVRLRGVEKAGRGGVMRGMCRERQFPCQRR